MSDPKNSLLNLPLSRRGLLRAGVGVAATSSLVACGGDPKVAIDTSLPVGSFGANSTAEEVTEGLDLTGMTALVTGCNSGLGYETMRVLALRGAHVIGTGRTLEKAAKACASVPGETTPVELELSNFESAVDCAEKVAGMVDKLDMLICNAGINTFGELELINGVEKIFVVNHLGHFVLVNHLLPLVNAAVSGRIVHVGSRSGYGQAPAVGIDFDNLRGEGEWDSGEAYGRSKLANALFSLQLSKQLAGSSATSNVIHPGLVQTNIARTAPAFIRGAFDLLGGLVAKSPAQGAATQCYVATSPLLEGVSGAYFEDCNPVTINVPNHVFDEPMAAELWQVSLDMTEGFI
jgi:NAD(P)-dependent dehydrogenase (short-subunit alcohol dehydrogenase family)